MGLFSKAKESTKKIRTVNQLKRVKNIQKKYYLDKNEATALIVYLLSYSDKQSSYGQHEMYATGIMKYVEHHFTFKLSEKILYAALDFLEGEENKTDFILVTSRNGKTEGRGRPPKMLKLNVEEHPDMQSLTFEQSMFWSTFGPRFQK